MILSLLLLSPDLLPIPDPSRVALEPGTPHTIAVAVPAPPRGEPFAPEGWYGRLTLEVVAAEGPVEVAVGDRTASREGPGPLALHLPALPPEQELTIAVRAPAGATVEGLALERHHVAPSLQLLGKANGHLGPDRLDCGALGFVAVTEHLHRAFAVVEVRPPAREAGLRPGDLVVAVEGTPLAPSSIAPGWDWFERSHEAALGRALEAAARAGRSQVRLSVWREGAAEELALPFALPATLGDGFPLRGELGRALYADLIRWAVAHQREDGGWPGTDAVNPALGGLALLGTRDPAHTPAVRRCVEYLLEKHPRPSEMAGLCYWTIAFQGIFLCEYHLASGDEAVLPWIREAIEWLPTTTHSCKWGMQAFGHGPDGLPYDNKALMAPTAHLLVFDALARRCGVEARVWEHVREYVIHSWSDPEAGGHGAMGYNASCKDLGEFWSRTGLVALATALRGESGTMRERLCVIMAERHPWMLNSHAYGEPGAALGLIGLAVAHPPSFEEVLPQWGWRYLGAWEPGYGLRYSTPHMGAPYMGGESVLNLAHGVLFSAAHGGLVITGGAGERWID